MAIFAISCDSKKPEETNYDGKEFDLSTNQDKTVLATTSKVGNGYHLVISGNGEVKSFDSKNAVPWNAISKKIEKVTIEEGIENIGAYFFSGLTLNEYFIPASVKKVSENSFNESALVYSHSTEAIEVLCSNKVYLYSSSRPQVDNQYWHKIGEDVVLWRGYKLLFIGNSFTFYPTDLFGVDNPAVCFFLKELAKSMDISLDIDFVVKGAHTLKKFASSSDEYGKIVDQKLNENSNYDYVILQEQSTTPINDYNSFNTSVIALMNKINKTQKNAKVILYATWGFPSEVTSGKYESVRAMEKLITSAYEKCAEENDLTVHYVGKSFTYVYENMPEITIFGSDDKHQNYAGAYLSACVHLSSLLNVDVRNATYNGDLDENVAFKLKEVAYQISAGK